MDFPIDIFVNNYRSIYQQILGITEDFW